MRNQAANPDKGSHMRKVGYKNHLHSRWSQEKTPTFCETPNEGTTVLIRDDGMRAIVSTEGPYVYLSIHPKLRPGGKAPSREDFEEAAQFLDVEEWEGLEEMDKEGHDIIDLHDRCHKRMVDAFNRF